MKFIPNLLKLKHWQLFVIILAIPIILNSFIDPCVKSSIVLTVLDTIISTLAWLIIFGWYYQITTRIGAFPLSTGELIIFKIVFVLLILYLLSAQAVLIYTEAFGQIVRFDPYLEGLLGFAITASFGVIMLALFAYYIFVTAKTLAHNMPTKSTELYMALLFMFPIGLWFIQPDINRIQGKESIS